MFDRVNAILESEGNKLIENHEDVIVEAMTLVNDFSKELKAFVLNHPEEFIGENTEETFKNIRTFAEVGTSQFITEISNLYGEIIQEQTIVEDRGLAEYL